MDLLFQERHKFIRGAKLPPSLSLKNRDDYDVGIGKAFDDAFNQYARREKKRYADEKKRWIAPVAARLYAYFSSDHDTFEQCFADCIVCSEAVMDNQRFGIAQKMTNMAFKYLWCYADAEEFEDKFRHCHMPLDKYTVRWVRSLNDGDVNQRLSAVDNAWSRIDESLYHDIQRLITNTLKNRVAYTVTYNRFAAVTTYILPQNQLHAECIIWHQERINELYRLLKRSESDFERLGIEWI